jgi:hypothetical protein
MDTELVNLAERSRSTLPTEFFAYRDYIDQKLSEGSWPSPLTYRSSGGEGVWARVGNAALAELHDLFCTQDARYSHVRDSATSFSRTALPIVAGYVAATAGISVAFASASVAFVAISVFRVGVGVFCRIATSSPKSQGT